MAGLRKDRFFLGLCAGLFLLIVGGTLALIFFQNRKAMEARDEAFQIQQAINDVQAFSSTMKSAVLAHHRFLLTGNKKYLAIYQTLKLSKEEMEASTKRPPYRSSGESPLDDLLQLIDDQPEQRKLLDTLLENMVKAFEELDRLAVLRTEGSAQDLNSRFNFYLQTRIEPLQSSLSLLLKQQIAALGQQSILREVEADRRLILILGIVCFLFVMQAVLFLWGYRQWRAARRAEAESHRQAASLQAANDALEVVNQQIRESHEIQMRAIIDHAIDGQILMDDQGRMMNANLSAQRMLQYEGSCLAGQNIASFLAEPYASQTLDHLREHREKNLCNGTDHRHESVAKRRDGSTFPIDLSMTMFRLGGVLYFSWFFRDITVQKKNEEDRRLYLEQLEKSNQELDEFAYIASHDLKEPLRGLFNHAKFLAEDYADQLNDEGKRRLDRLLYLSRRMEQLINDLLYFSRLGRTDLAVQATDIEAVVDDIRTLLEAALAAPDVSLAVVSPLPSVVCDKLRITEVFRNLIINAIKYNDKPQKTVEIGFREVAPSPFGEQKNVFFVKDNGIGIDKAYFEEIFHLFKRLHVSVANDQGTGVGLTFVRKIVEQHGGLIWLESTPSLGTTFFFNLGTQEKSK